MAKDIVIDQDSHIFEETNEDVIISTAEQISNTSIFIEAQSVSSTEMNLSSCYMSLNADGNISLQNIKTRGHLPSNLSNSAVIINSNGEIVIEDCIFDQFGVNCLEINSALTYANREITIRNCVFSEDIEKNSIIISKVLNDAVINIIDCEFKSTKSAPIKFCNQLNKSGIEINLQNCSIALSVNSKSANILNGIIAFEDTVATSVMDVRESNKFRYSKITVNFIDVVNLATGEVINPEEQSCVIGTFDKNQIAYVFNAFEGKVFYKSNPLRYPIFTFVDNITHYIDNTRNNCGCGTCGVPDINDNFVLIGSSGGSHNCSCESSVVGGSDSSSCCTDSSNNSGNVVNSNSNCCSCCNQCGNVVQGYRPGPMPPTEIPTVKRKQEIVNGGWEDWNTVFQGIGSSYWNLEEGFVYENIAKEIAKTFPNVIVDVSNPLEAIDILRKYGVMKYQKNYPLEVLLDKLVKDKYIYRNMESQ